MLWTVSVALLVLWLLGLICGLQLGAWVHALLLLGMVLLAVDGVRARWLRTHRRSPR